MTLHFIGLGLNDEKDISVKGFETVKKCEIVYLDNYTSILSCPIETLEKFYNKKIILANRSLVEADNNQILKDAQHHETAFLVIGDPMAATTHVDLLLRAKKLGIKTAIIHNSSIFSAIGVTGLQLYKFGRVSSIPFNNENIEVPYDNLKINVKNDMHSLFLLDFDNEQKKYMTINDAIRFLLKVEIKRGENIFKDSTKIIACQKIGSKDQKIKYGKASELLKENFILFPQCFIVPAKLHFMEEEALGMWR